tara:strand:- start:247842 stop:248537 length:696 start_codon:yes stop_codon:yes gene_type:complete
MLDPSLLGRLTFHPVAPTKSGFPPGRHHLGIADERDTVLYVPQDLDTSVPVKLLIMFHGAGGFPEKVLPFLEPYADLHKFIILAPHSKFPTWDLVIGGNGPDLERLNLALNKVADHYVLDPKHLGFMGHSDGASYALSIGLTNGDIASHVIVNSGGFMSVFMQEGTPLVFIAHGLQDEQLPIERSGRAHATQLKEAGYEVKYVEHNGPHAIQPAIIELAIDFFINREVLHD